MLPSCDSSRARPSSAGRCPVLPTRESLRSTAVAAPRPPDAVIARPVAARLAPPPAPPAFTRKVEAIREGRRRAGSRPRRRPRSPSKVARGRPGGGRDPSRRAAGAQGAARSPQGSRGRTAARPDPCALRATRDGERAGRASLRRARGRAPARVAPGAVVPPLPPVRREPRGRRLRNRSAPFRRRRPLRRRRRPPLRRLASPKPRARAEAPGSPFQPSAATRRGARPGPARARGASRASPARSPKTRKRSPSRSRRSRSPRRARTRRRRTSRSRNRRTSRNRRRKRRRTSRRRRRLRPAAWSSSRRSDRWQRLSSAQ